MAVTGPQKVFTIAFISISLSLFQLRFQRSDIEWDQFMWNNKLFLFPISIFDLLSSSSLSVPVWPWMCPIQVGQRYGNSCCRKQLFSCRSFRGDDYNEDPDDRHDYEDLDNRQ